MYRTALELILYIEYIVYIYCHRNAYCLSGSWNGNERYHAMQDVPMFSATSAKRPRRQGLTDTLTVVGQTIANAITPQVGTREAPVPVEQVLNCLQ